MEIVGYEVCEAGSYEVFSFVVVHKETIKRFTGDHYDLDEMRVFLDSIRVAELHEYGMIGNNVCFDIKVAGTKEGAIRIVPVSNVNDFLLTYRRIVEVPEIKYFFLTKQLVNKIKKWRKYGEVKCR